MATAAKTIKATYSKSAIGYKKDQKATIAALGFKKLGQTRELADTPAIRGMLRKVSHLVTVQEQ
jgi:large subunit ribosomal protein L30